MGAVAKKLTWDDIKHWPEYHGRTELVDGKLVMSPVPSSRHQRICTKLGIRIGSFVYHHDLGEFFSSPLHIVLDEGVDYEPDVCFISKSRLKAHSLDVAFHGPPDLIIEVISGSNRKHDTVTKFRHYEKYGVREYWLVDQKTERFEVWCLEGARYVSRRSFGRGQPVVTRVLKGLRLDPAQVF